jgi:hypothetical protein
VHLARALLITGIGVEQVVYILDQVRAMEKEMLKNIKQQGLDIQPQIVVVNGLLKSGMFLGSLQH